MHDINCNFIYMQDFNWRFEFNYAHLEQWNMLAPNGHHAIMLKANF